MNKTQIFFLIGVVAIALHFSIKLGQGIFKYSVYSAHTPAQIVQWETVPAKDRFHIKATYKYALNQKNYSQVHTFTSAFLSESAAIHQLKDLAKQPYTAWYNPQNPEQSLLEKTFPWGLFFRTSICYGVLIYFFYLYKRLSIL